MSLFDASGALHGSLAEPNKMQFLFQQPAGACFQVVVLAGAGRLPSSGSAPLSATALEHRVRHPASLWGSARRASGAQTRIRASNCASNRQRAGTMSAASSSPSPGPRCVCRLSHHVSFRRVEVGGRPVGGSNGMYLRRCSATNSKVAEGVNTAA